MTRFFNLSGRGGPGLTAAALALACLLGLAACGGGGGGGGGGSAAPAAGDGGGGGTPTPGNGGNTGGGNTGGNGGNTGGGNGGDTGGGNGGNAGGGGTTVTLPAYLIEENDAAAVTTLDTAIALFDPSLRVLNNHLHVYSASRAGASYTVTATGDDAPGITVLPFRALTEIDLPRVALGRDNAYRFDEMYTSGGKDYQGTVLLFHDPDLEGKDYHYWGVWMRRHEEANGTVTWDHFQTFSARMVAASPQWGEHHIGNARGTASYTGTANGVYGTGGSIGWFTADTKLTVNFGGDDVADADKFTMTGTIDRFNLSGNENVSWSVALTGAAKKNDAGALTENFWSGTASGGGKEGVMDAVKFYAPTLSSLLPDQPDLVAGQFKAYFADGVAAGAFNATHNDLYVPPAPPPPPPDTPLPPVP